VAVIVPDRIFDEIVKLGSVYAEFSAGTDFGDFVSYLATGICPATGWRQECSKYPE
jgi:hypothetical protein